MEDASEPILVSDDLDAAKAACRLGLPCIAITCDWNRYSDNAYLLPMTDLDKFAWKGRKVYMCFRSDLISNPRKIIAVFELSSELHERGARVRIKHFSDIEPRRFFSRKSRKAFLKLEESEFSETKHLWGLNREIAFIGRLNSVWEFRYKNLYPNYHKLLFRFSDRMISVLKADGSGFKRINAVDAWVKWKYRRYYIDLGYFPGRGPVVDEQINTWQGWGVVSRKGSVRPFLDLLKYLFAGEDELREWFIKWLAYPLQNPGSKVYTAVLLHSRRQGVGKSFIGYIMGDIYGDNFNVVGLEDLHGAFNGWVVSKQFILGEEITGTYSRKEADRIKNMITREKVYVRLKYEPEYRMDDCANYLLTSNHVDALFLDEFDRRVVVHEIRSAAKPNSFYARIDKWRRNGGPACLFYYLLHSVDLTGFNPKAPAPMSQAKLNMIALSKSDVDLAVIDLKENPDQILKRGERRIECDLITARDLASFLPHSDSRRINLVSLSKSLSREGFRQRRLSTCEGTQRLWAVRNSKKWNAAENSEWVKHFNLCSDKRRREKFS